MFLFVFGAIITDFPAFLRTTASTTTTVDMACAVATKTIIELQIFLISFFSNILSFIIDTYANREQNNFPASRGSFPGVR